jgi:predicted secreted hydrolase
MRRKHEPLWRRRVLAWLAGAPLALTVLGRGGLRAQSSPPQESALAQFAEVVPGYVMRFPHDEGSHPAFRIEWWYVTGWLKDQAQRDAGFQITFFRARPELRHDNPSAFAPRQILIAHAAVSDPAHGRLLSVERAARTAFDLAGAAIGRTDVWVDDWRLTQHDASYHARLPAHGLHLELAFTATQPPLLQGEMGLSRKGPQPESASYYYSLPHLLAEGVIIARGERRVVRGRAWLDHEWSSSYMPGEAVGWDWAGINLDDGGALMAFRMRDERGGAFWAGGTLRRPDGSRFTYGPDEIRFTPRRLWRSPRSGASYPVAWTLRAGSLELMIEPMMDDQENDARRTTGTLYWEGAVQAVAGSRPVGRGYLELTGYWRPFRF